MTINWQIDHEVKDSSVIMIFEIQLNSKFPNSMPQTIALVQ